MMTHTLHRLVIYNKFKSQLTAYKSEYMVRAFLRLGLPCLNPEEECPDCPIRPPCPPKKYVRRKRPPPCPPKPCPKINLACDPMDPPEHCPYKPPPCPPKCDNRPKKKRAPPATCEPDKC